MAKLKCNMGFSKVACLKVRVTAEDIMKGRRGNARHCAIARAITRETGAPAIVGGTIEVKGTHFVIPKAIQAFIRMWDRTTDPDCAVVNDTEVRKAKRARAKFKPFTIELHAQT